MKKLLCLLLVTVLFVGCTPQAKNLAKNYQQKIENISGTPSEILVKTQFEFGAEILKQSFKNDNVLISPLSIKLALAMVFNGADNETKSQMASVLGLSPEELNVELYKYVSTLKNDKTTLHIANSLWLKNDNNFIVKDEFLQTNVNYYNAGVFKENFDSKTAKKINGWVKENTKGMIDEIIDAIDPETVMYLINALAFEAEWLDVYEKSEVDDGTFTALSQEKQKVKMMSSTENTYIENDDMTGFIKHYKGNGFAFVAMLPKDDIESFISSLDGEKIQDFLENKRTNTVYCKMPKFKYDYDIKLNDILISMGMPDAFDIEKADFSGISQKPQYIGQVLHKTHITVDELGTKAGAVTAIANCGSAMPTDPKKVVLDRPFAYMIIDTTTNLPIFMGTVTEIR